MQGVRGSNPLSSTKESFPKQSLSRNSGRPLPEIPDSFGCRGLTRPRAPDHWSGLFAAFYQHLSGMWFRLPMGRVDRSRATPPAMGRLPRSPRWESQPRAGPLLELCSISGQGSSGALTEVMAGGGSVRGQRHLIGGIGATLPAMRLRLGVGAGGLAVLMVCLAAAALVSMQIGGRLADSRGARNVALPACALLIAGVMSLAFARPCRLPLRVQRWRGWATARWMSR